MRRHQCISAVTARVIGFDPDDIRELADDFATELRRKYPSQKTIDGHLICIGCFADFFEEHKLSTPAPDITRVHIAAYIEDLLSRPNKRTGEPLSPEYARSRYRSFQQVFEYLASEKIIHANPFDKMSPPAVPEQQVPVPSEDAVEALLSECEGADFNDRRDTANIRWEMVVPLRNHNTAELIGDPLDTVAAGNHHGLTVPAPKVEDCEFRMLEPYEIKQAMAFDRDYLMLGNRRE